MSSKQPNKRAGKTLDPRPELDTAYMSPNESSPELFHVPILPHALHKNHLRIAVPGKEPFELGEPIQLSEENAQPNFSKAQFSQLPTPVISGGGFTKLLIPPKRSNRSVGSGRAVSEFVPSNYENRSPVDRPVSSRNVSNPAEIKTPEKQQNIPLPPLDFASDYSEKLIYSPSLRSYFAPGVIIGTGSFSTVILAQQISDPNVVVAIKIISVPTTDLASIKNFKSYISRELGILSNMQHPCVIKLFDYNLTMQISPQEIANSFNTVSSSRSVESIHEQAKFDAELESLLDEHNLRSSNKQYYFLQYCPGGNLFQYLELRYNLLAHDILFWKLLTRITAELVAAVSYLHTQRVVHRDIKLENILLNFKLDNDLADFNALAEMNPIITLTDFGLSKRIAFKNQLLTTKCGSQDYVSPELLMGLDYDGMLLDAWSIGVVIYAMIENRLPFDIPPLEFMEASNISPSVIKRRRMRHNPAYRIAMIDWDWYRTLNLLNDRLMSEECKQLIKNLMAVVDALLIRKEKRKSATDLLHDSDFFWIRELLPRSILEFDSI